MNRTFARRGALFAALVTTGLLGACQLATEFDRTLIDAGATDTGIAEVAPVESSTTTDASDGGKDAPTDTPITPDAPSDTNTTDAPDDTTTDAPTDTNTTDAADAGADAPDDADDAG